MAESLKRELTTEFGKLLEKQESRISEPEATVSILQNNVSLLKNQMAVAEDSNEEFEQYGRRLCLRVEGMRKHPK